MATRSPTLVFGRAAGAEGAPTAATPALELEVLWGDAPDDPVILRVAAEGGAPHDFTFANQRVFQRFMNEEVSAAELEGAEQLSGLSTPAMALLLSRAQGATDVVPPRPRATGAPGQGQDLNDVRGGNIFVPENRPLPAGLAAPGVGSGLRTPRREHRLPDGRLLPSGGGTRRDIPRFEPAQIPRDHLLHRTSQPVREVTPDVRQLVRDMVATMNERPTAVGLAAPQIGVDQQVFVMRHDGVTRAFINPRIVERGEDHDTWTETLANASPLGAALDLGERVKNLGEHEGCLSLHGFGATLDRSDWVVLEATDIHGRPVRVRFEGYEARIVQHEVDHLNGTLISDRAAQQS